MARNAFACCLYSAGNVLLIDEVIMEVLEMDGRADGGRLFIVEFERNGDESLRAMCVSGKPSAVIFNRMRSLLRII